MEFKNYGMFEQFTIKFNSLVKSYTLKGFPSKTGEMLSFHVIFPTLTDKSAIPDMTEQGSFAVAPRHSPYKQRFWASQSIPFLTQVS
jgi:hypothetical protein